MHQLFHSKRVFFSPICTCLSCKLGSDGTSSRSFFVNKTAIIPPGPQFHIDAQHFCCSCFNPQFIYRVYKCTYMHMYMYNLNEIGVQMHSYTCKCHNFIATIRILYFFDWNIPQFVRCTISSMQHFNAHTPNSVHNISHAIPN